MSRKRPLPDDDFGDAPESLTRKQVQEAIRKRQSLIDADMRGLDLSHLVFDGMNLSRTKFADAVLTGCSFKAADLTFASFWNADLSDCNFETANLENADFDYANLNGATLKGARIKKALFPLSFVPLATIHESVRSGARIRMDAPPDEDR